MNVMYNKVYDIYISLGKVNIIQQIAHRDHYLFGIKYATLFHTLYKKYSGKLKNNM